MPNKANGFFKGLAMQNIRDFVVANPQLLSYRDHKCATVDELADYITKNKNFRHILLDSYTIRMGIMEGKVKIKDLFDSYDNNQSFKANVELVEKRIGELNQAAAPTNTPTPGT